MRVLSWNVNGLRAVMKKGFPAWLEGCGADIVGLQETRAELDQVQADVALLPGFHFTMQAAAKKGYSGVGLLSRQPPDSVVTTLGDDEMDQEGRVQIARFGRLTVVNVYVPNGNGKLRDNSRIPFKLNFQRRLWQLLEDEKQQGGRILVMGDINTAPSEIDLARPKENQKTSGFTPIEREEVARWLATGWVDTFRHFETGPGHYSWWSSRFGVREKNIGWRIDLAFASPGLVPFLRRGFIEKDVLGSDHCPIGVDLDDAVLA